MTVFESAVQILKRHEGLSLKPYPDVDDTVAIGYGRNLTLKGITAEEAEYLLRGDVRAAHNYLRASPNTKDIYRNLTAARKVVLLDMAVNLGFRGLLGFKRMWAALCADDYEIAADEMLDSKWAVQVAPRGQELAGVMRDPAKLKGES